MKIQIISPLICVVLLAPFTVSGQVDSVYFEPGIRELTTGKTTMKEALKILGRKGAKISKPKRGDRFDTHMGHQLTQGSICYPEKGLKLTFVKSGPRGKKQSMGDVILTKITVNQIIIGADTISVGVTRMNVIEKILGPPETEEQQYLTYVYIGQGFKITLSGYGYLELARIGIIRNY